MSMDPGREEVKQTSQRRAYDASGRRERAQRRREATLDAARDRFMDLGYGATTVESIGEAARVSAATIYKSYGGKAGIIRALCQRALAGEGPVPAEQRSDALRSTSDGHTLVGGWGRL